MTHVDLILIPFITNSIQFFSTRFMIFCFACWMLRMRQIPWCPSGSQYNDLSINSHIECATSLCHIMNTFFIWVCFYWLHEMTRNGCKTCSDFVLLSCNFMFRHECGLKILLKFTMQTRVFQCIIDKNGIWEGKTAMLKQSCEIKGYNDVIKMLLNCMKIDVMMR